MKGKLLIIVILLIPIVPSTSDNSVTNEISNQILDSIKVDNQPFNVDIDFDYPKIAFVFNSFNAAAYSGYYKAFAISSYGKYYQPKLDAAQYFIQSPSNSWSTSSPVAFISKLISDGYPSSKISYITDIDVHNDNLYDEFGVPKYSTIIFVHNEYVTMDEYLNMVKFMKSGGNVIMMNGNAFFAEVDYNAETNKVHLVSGHGWDFDGENGTRASDYRRFWQKGISDEHSTMMGNTYTLFNKGQYTEAVLKYSGDNPHPVALEMNKKGYTSIGKSVAGHEENTIVTSNYHEIADWKSNFDQPLRGVKIYEFMPFGPVGGSLVHLGLYTTDWIANREPMRKLFLEIVKHQGGLTQTTPWIRYPMNGAVLRDNIILDYTTLLNVDIYINNTLYPNLSKGSSLDFLSEGRYELKMMFYKNDDLIEKKVMFSVDRTVPQFEFSYNQTLPDSDPRKKIPIYIKLVEDNPEILFSSIIKGMRNIGGIVASAADNNGYMIKELNISIPTDEKNFSFRVFARDSAGNYNMKFFSVHENSSIPVINQTYVFLNRTSNTQFEVRIPKNKFTTSNLQISSDFGKNWSNYPFIDLNKDQQIAYYTRNEDRLLYRVAIRYNGITDYMQSIKSYQWDVNIPIISANNIKNIHSPGDKIQLHINKYSIGSMDYNVTLMKGNSKINSSQTKNSIEKSTDIKYTIPNVDPGKYKLLVSTNFGGKTNSKLLEFTVSYSSTEKVTENIEIPLRSMEPLKLNYSVSSKSEYIDVIYGDNIIESIPSKYFKDIKVSMITNLVVKEYDANNTLIKETNYYFDLVGQPPYISGIENENMSIGDEIFVSFVIFGKNESDYNIFENDVSKVTGTWVNGQIILYNIINPKLGTYNITIIAYNLNGLQNKFTTIITILELKISITNTTISNTTSSIPASTTTSSSITSIPYNKPETSDYTLLWIIGLSLAIIPIVYIARKKIKVS